MKQKKTHTLIIQNNEKIENKNILTYETIRN